MEDRDLDRRIRIGRLKDLYASLVTPHGARICALYCEEDLTLQEIADLLSEEGTPVTRQGVYDALNRTERKLEELEQKLGLLERSDRTEKQLDLALEALERNDPEAAGRILRQMKNE